MESLPEVRNSLTMTRDITASGTESAWAYTHLPREVADDASAERLSQAVDRVLEDNAPVFSEHIVAKHFQRPSNLGASDATCMPAPSTVLPRN